MSVTAPLRILYRADAGKGVGTGHVLRAVRLLTALRHLAATDAVLAIADDPIGRRLCADCPAEVVVTGPLRSNRGKPFFDPTSLDFARGRGEFDLLAVDMLDTPAGSLDQVRSLARAVVTFDDRGAGRVGAEAIINVLVREPEPAALPDNVRVEEGPQYATLDPVYAEAAPVRQFRRTGLHALVTLGGADTGGLSLKVLRALRSVSGIESVSVVCGIGSEWSEQAEAEGHGAPWRLKLLRQVPNLRSLFLEADIAFVAGGLTMHEACCTGTPSVAVCQPIDHQPELASWFAARGAMLSVGDGMTADVEAIAETALRLVHDPCLRIALSEAGRRAVDGRGTERTARLLLTLAGLRCQERSHE